MKNMISVNLLMSLFSCYNLSQFVYFSYRIVILRQLTKVLHVICHITMFNLPLKSHI